MENQKESKIQFFSNMAEFALLHKRLYIESANKSLRAPMETPGERWLNIQDIIDAGADRRKAYEWHLRYKKAIQKLQALRAA